MADRIQQQSRQKRIYTSVFTKYTVRVRPPKDNAQPEVLNPFNTGVLALRPGSSSLSTSLTKVFSEASSFDPLQLIPP